ncbi:MAG: hypothetical protein U0638_01190 [Phycisphaerales bacterium]
MSEKPPSLRLCVDCGYDLAGLDGEDAMRCPECGKKFDPRTGPFCSPWPPLSQYPLHILKLLASTAIPMAGTFVVALWPRSPQPSWALLVFFLGILGFGYLGIRMSTRWIDSMVKPRLSEQRRHALRWVLWLISDALLICSTAAAIFIAWAVLRLSD